LLSETMEMLLKKHKGAIRAIAEKTSLDAINDTDVVALFIAVHLKRVDVEPNEVKEVDSVMKTLVDTGFVDGSMQPAGNIMDIL